MTLSQKVKSLLDSVRFINLTTSVGRGRRRRRDEHGGRGSVGQ